MVDLEWDDENITCPHCVEVQGDNWDYDWGSRESLETDCGSCCKPIILHRSIDGVADALGLDDRDPRVSWRYEQRRTHPRKTGAVELGTVKGYGVEVRVVPATAP